MVKARAAECREKLYTRTDSARVLGCEKSLIRWHTHVLKLVQHVSGNQKMISELDLRKIEAVFLAEDPGRVFWKSWNAAAPAARKSRALTTPSAN